MSECTTDYVVSFSLICCNSY